MSDTGNVVRWLEQCVFEGDTCVSCPYKQHTACKFFLMRDALDLIKNQQKELERNQVTVCPHCGKRIK